MKKRKLAQDKNEFSIAMPRFGTTCADPSCSRTFYCDGGHWGANDEVYCEQCWIHWERQVWQALQNQLHQARCLPEPLHQMVGAILEEFLCGTEECAQQLMRRGVWWIFLLGPTFPAGQLRKLQLEVVVASADPRGWEYRDTLFDYIITFLC
jgi:hypothetical protein